MVWGLAVQGGRLYYSVADAPSIWSVRINADGSFGACALGARRQRHPGTTRSPTSRSTSGPHVPCAARRHPRQLGLRRLRRAQEVPVFRFRREFPDDPATPGTWEPNPEDYAIGFPPAAANASGGIALGYGFDAAGKKRKGACNQMIWSRATIYVTIPSCRPERAAGGPAVVHGLQGNDRGLIRPDNEPPLNAYFVDYDGEYESARETGHVGDVEIWQPCERDADFGSNVPLPVPQDFAGKLPPIGEPPYGYNLRVDKETLAGPCLAGGLGLLCDYVIRVTNMGADPYVGPIVVNDKLPAAQAGAVMTFARATAVAVSRLLADGAPVHLPAAVLWPGRASIFTSTSICRRPSQRATWTTWRTRLAVWVRRCQSRRRPCTRDRDRPGRRLPAGRRQRDQPQDRKVASPPVCDDAGRELPLPLPHRRTQHGTRRVQRHHQGPRAGPAGTTAMFAPFSRLELRTARPQLYLRTRSGCPQPGNQGVGLIAYVTVPKALAAASAVRRPTGPRSSRPPAARRKTPIAADDQAEATAFLPALCPILPLLNNLKLEKTGPGGLCPVAGANWVCEFKLKITNGAKPYNSQLQVLDALPFGTPAGTTIDFTPPAGWNCGAAFPNIYACHSANPNLAPGASVEIPFKVKVPVGPATPCTVKNNAQIIKAPPGTLLNIFNNDDFDSASAQFATVLKPDGTFICASPAMGGGDDPPR